MSDNKKLNVSLTFVKNLPGGSININQVEQLAATIKPVPGLIGAANLSPEKLGATFAGDRRTLNRSRELSEAKSVQQTKPPAKSQKSGAKLFVLEVARIFSRKMYTNFQNIKDSKRKTQLRRTFLKTLAVLEQAKALQYKGLAWFALLRNSYNVDKLNIDKSTKAVAKAKDSNTKRCLLILRKRYTTLLRVSLERIRKNSKKVGLLVHPINSLSHFVLKKLQVLKQKACFKIRRFGKRRELFKLGFNILKNVFKGKLGQHLTLLRGIPIKAGPASPVATSKIAVTSANRSVRSTSVSNANQSTPRRGTATPNKREPTGPTEEEKLNAQIDELTKQKQSINAEARTNIEAIETNVQELERRIEQQTNRKKQLEKRSKPEPTPSPTRAQKQKTATPAPPAEQARDPYYEILKTIYEIVSSGPDSIRKRDIVTKFELDLDQLQQTVEHELDRNQQLKDTINHIEDFLCPDQAIQRPELQIDEANRLLQHENLQLKKVLQRYIVETYGRNLYEQAKKTYGLLAERIGQSRGSPTRS